MPAWWRPSRSGARPNQGWRCELGKRRTSATWRTAAPWGGPTRASSKRAERPKLKITRLGSHRAFAFALGIAAEGVAELSFGAFEAGTGGGGEALPGAVDEEVEHRHRGLKLGAFGAAAAGDGAFQAAGDVGWRA